MFTCIPFLLQPARAALSLLVLAVSPTVSAQQPHDSSRTSEKAPLPPGRLVDVGGRRLHIHCTGRGGPAVVLEAGAGDFSLDWSLLQPRVARFTRVGSYDRAGYGWSDPGPTPRTMRQIATELHTGLHNAGIKGPYVLVGQSLGGLIVRVFAALFPGDVAGIVLVDSSHEDMYLSLQGPGDKEPKVVRFRELSRGRAIPAVQETMPARAVSPSAGTEQPPAAARLPAPSKLESPYDKLPADVQRLRLWAMARPDWGAARGSEFDYLPEELAQIHASRANHAYPLGNIPLIVLTRGTGDYPEGGGAITAKQLDEDHRRLQADLTRLSRNSLQIVAEKSGHHIQLDDPGLVADAIREVVDAVRHHTRLGPSN